MKPYHYEDPSETAHSGSTVLDRIIDRSPSLGQHLGLPGSFGLVDSLAYRFRSKYKSILNESVLHDRVKVLTAKTRVLKAETDAVHQGTELIRAVTNAERAGCEQTRVPKEDLVASTELDLQQAQLEFEIAKIQHEKQKLAVPQVPTDERAGKRAYWLAEIDRLKQEKAQAAARAEDEMERMQVENIYDDRLRNAREQWSKYL